MKPPEKIPEGGFDPEMRRKYNALLAYVRTLTPRESATMAVSHTEGGVVQEVKPSARGSGDSTTPRWG